MDTVGIVSPGAMGSAVGRALASAGSRVVVTLGGRSERTHRLAAGLETLGSLDEVVRTADVVLSIVPPGEALEVAATIALAAERAGARPLVADLNALAPTTMRAVASRLEAAGLDAVDGSISGPPPRPGGVTRVYLAGTHATRVAALEGPGLELRVVGEMVGTASAVKMSTASFYKGQAALLTQALRAARANGVLDLVLDDLRRSYPELVADAPRLVRSAAAKSGRYVAEMGEIALSQREAGLTADLFAAMAGIYLELSETDLAGLAPEQAGLGGSLENALRDLDPGSPS